MSNSKTEIIFFIDESYDSDFCGICVVCIQGGKGCEISNEIKKKLPNKIHYHDDNISIRQKIAPYIAFMPISSYIAVAKDNFPKDVVSKYEFIYKTLLPEILKPLEMKFSKRLKKEKINFKIKFENLTDKPRRDIKFFESVLNKIPSCKNMNYEVVTKKSEPLIFLPDYFIGFIRDHLSIKKKTWPIKSLNLLSEKIGLFLIFENGKIIRYTRTKRICDYLS